MATKMRIRFRACCRFQATPQKTMRHCRLRRINARAAQSKKKKTARFPEFSSGLCFGFLTLFCGSCCLPFTGKLPCAPRNSLFRHAAVSIAHAMGSDSDDICGVWPADACQRGTILRDRSNLAAREFGTQTLLYQDPGQPRDRGRWYWITNAGLTISIAVHTASCRRSLAENAGRDILEILMTRDGARRMVEAAVHNETYIKEVRA